MKWEKWEDVTIIALMNEHLDSGNCREIKGALDRLTPEDRKVILDFSGVNFVDSTGLGVIISTVNQIQENRGRLKICRVSHSVQILFDLVRLSKIVDFYETREEAGEAFGVKLPSPR